MGGGHETMMGYQGGCPETMGHQGGAETTGHHGGVETMEYRKGEGTLWYQCGKLRASEVVYDHNTQGQGNTGVPSLLWASSTGCYGKIL